MMSHLDMRTLPFSRSQFAALSPAERLARLMHESYERHAAQEFGYLPRLWEQLLPADQRIRISVAEELLTRDLFSFEWPEDDR